MSSLTLEAISLSGQILDSLICASHSERKVSKLDRNVQRRRASGPQFSAVSL
jgi:hypothetical protein